MVCTSPIPYSAGPLPTFPLPWDCSWARGRDGKHSIQVSSGPNPAPVGDVNNLSGPLSAHIAPGGSMEQLQLELQVSPFSHPKGSLRCSSTISPIVHEVRRPQ